MKVGFPNMGNAFITAKAVLDDLGVDYVLPPETSRRTLELGSRWVPEGACMPLKITVGNLIETHELGADTQMMIGSWGPCRFGYYCQMQREVLQDCGCGMQPIHLEVCRGGPAELARRIRMLAGGLHPARMAAAVVNAAVLSQSVDDVERLYRRVAAREAVSGSAADVYDGFLRGARQTVGSRALKRLCRGTLNALQNLPLDWEAQPLRVGIVGEIYGTIDQWTAMGMERKLGRMGVEVERHVTIGGWINDYMVKKALHAPRDMRWAKAAIPYLGEDIGGHTRETIGHTVLHARRGFDGVIQIYPLGCMPEIVAQCILPEVSRDFDLPVLTLVMDEMTGEAGYTTRVEAFIDLLLNRRELRAKKLAGGAL